MTPTKLTAGVQRGMFSRLAHTRRATFGEIAHPRAVTAVGHVTVANIQWSQPLGLPAAPLSFQDLFSLDPEFLAFIPQPVRAVLLLFPQRGALAKAREEEEKSGEHKFDGDVWWVKQTVSVAAPLAGSSPLWAAQWAALCLSPSGPRSAAAEETEGKLTPDRQRVRIHRPPACTLEPARGQPRARQQAGPVQGAEQGS